MEWNGSGAIGILPSAFDAKTLPPNDEPINATIQEESADKEAGAATRRRRQTASQLLSKRRMSPLPIQTIPSSRTVWGLLILKRSMKVTAACLPRSTTRRSSTLRTSKLPPANQPVRKSAIIAFPEPSEVVFLPSGEVVAPTLLTLLGAKNTRNEIKKVTVVDPAPPPSLRLYAVAPDGGKTLEFDGDTLLAWRRLDIMQDVSYQIELEGFDRAPRCQYHRRGY